MYNGYMRFAFLIALLLLTGCANHAEAIDTTPVNFASVSELEEFLVEDDTDQLNNDGWCCLDYAENLQQNAL